jgi:hypothetical protein
MKETSQKMVRFFAPVVLLFAPAVAFAQAPQYPRRVTNLQDLINLFIAIIDRGLIPLLFAVALIYFLYNVYEYIKNPDLEALYKGKIFFGIIGLAIMVSVWGLVNLVVGTFNLPANQININQIIPKQ